jgi:hypothetical protein
MERESWTQEYHRGRLSIIEKGISTARDYGTGCIPCSYMKFSVDLVKYKKIIDKKAFFQNEA